MTFNPARRPDHQAHLDFAVDRLESRCLLSASLDPLTGLLAITGTEASDRIAVDVEQASLVVKVNRERSVFDLADVNQLEIDGLGGNDRIKVAADVMLSATIRGGDGNDNISAGSGDDSVDGGLGRDKLRGGLGNDDLRGGEDKDRIIGGAGHDNLAGGAGDDLLNGQDGNDQLRGEDGRDRSIGGRGFDLIYDDDGDGVARNGVIVDFDRELEIDLAGPTTAGGHAAFSMEREGDEIEVEFQLEIEDAALNSVHDVLVDNVLVGQIATDHTGHGSLKLSNDPDDVGEAPLPVDFPEISVHSVVTVGSILQGSFCVLTADIEFTTGNWYVAVGETLRLPDIIQSGGLSGITLSGSPLFAQPFQLGQSVTITAEMLLAGDQGPGEYRIHALDGDGNSVDHFTIRIV